MTPEERRKVSAVLVKALTGPKVDDDAAASVAEWLLVNEVGSMKPLLGYVPGYGSAAYPGVSSYFDWPLTKPVITPKQSESIYADLIRSWDPTGDRPTVSAPILRCSSAHEFRAKGLGWWPWRAVELERCTLDRGHPGDHKDKFLTTWPKSVLEVDAVCTPPSAGTPSAADTPPCPHRYVVGAGPEAVTHQCMRSTTVPHGEDDEKSKAYGQHRCGCGVVWFTKDFV